MSEHKEIPGQHQRPFWEVVNNRVAHGPEYNDGKVVVRSFLHQESNAGVPGSEVGGAAGAMNEVMHIMQDQLGYTVSSASLNPNTVDASLTSNATKLPFPADYIPRPADAEGKKITNNEQLAEALLKDALPASYVQYAAMLMNGSDVVFPNYWVSGMLAVKAKAYMEQLQKEGKPLWVDEHGKEYNVWNIPKVVYCNHSLPARIDEELSKRDPSTYKPMKEERLNFQNEIYEKADAIMVWTEAEKKLAKDAYPDIPDLPDRMHIVKAPVEFDSQKAQSIRSEKRKQLFGENINDETLVYYYQGRFADYKHPEMLLQSFIDLYIEEKDATGEEPNMACLLIGGPTEGNNVYEKMLTMLEKIPEQYREEIRKRVSLPGSQEKEVGHAAGDVLVFPSIKESFGLSLVEAVLGGNLVIARKDVPTVVEANGDSGFYATDSEGFTEAMKDLLHNAGKREELHTKLLKNARTYSPDQTAKDLQELLQSVDVKLA